GLPSVTSARIVGTSVTILAENNPLRACLKIFPLRLCASSVSHLLGKESLTLEAQRRKGKIFKQALSGLFSARIVTLVPTMRADVTLGKPQRSDICPQIS
ncbi:MAG TPA: hypothetical protein VJ715_08915, partial [Pyrinomonadaceae bacterium]|nr:hypothetical protein [Pyrinomonadaceae bacterium]